MDNTANIDQLREALEAHFGCDNVLGYTHESKGGWLRIDGEGQWYSSAQARRMLGLSKPSATPRQPRARISAYGDYATIAAMSGRLRG